MLLPSDIEMLIKTGLNSEQILLVSNIITTVTKRNEKRNALRNGNTVTLSNAALRQKRYRENKKKQKLNTHTVTPTLRNAVTESPIIDTFFLSSLPSKKDIILTKMPFTEIPQHWLVWATKEYGWGQDVITDTWQLFYEYWVNGKGKITKREKWGATWRQWCRTQSGRITTNKKYEEKPRYSEKKTGVITL